MKKINYLATLVTLLDIEKALKKIPQTLLNTAYRESMEKVLHEVRKKCYEECGRECLDGKITQD